MSTEKLLALPRQPLSGLMHLQIGPLCLVDGDPMLDQHDLHESAQAACQSWSRTDYESLVSVLCVLLKKRDVQFCHSLGGSLAATLEMALKTMCVFVAMAVPKPDHLQVETASVHQANAALAVHTLRDAPSLRCSTQHPGLMASGEDTIHLEGTSSARHLPRAPR
jgi:hypothetical protein